MEKIDAMDKSDVEAPGFEDELARYVMKGKKRAINTEKYESRKRKVWKFLLHPTLKSLLSFLLSLAPSIRFPE